MKTEIIIYDSHYLYLECINCFLEKNGFGKDYDFLNTINFDEVGNFVSDNTSILIMNIVGLELSDTFDFIENTLKRFCNLKIMILSPNTEMKVIKKFFEKGVKSFLTKNTNSTEFLNALKAVIEGKVYINDDAKKSLFDYIRKNYLIKKIMAVMN
jgi:DNA-binding NarL/FixJ family response regulator